MRKTFKHLLNKPIVDGTQQDLERVIIKELFDGQLGPEYSHLAEKLALAILESGVVVTKQKHEKLRDAAKLFSIEYKDANNQRRLDLGTMLDDALEIPLHLRK